MPRYPRHQLKSLDRFTNSFDSETVLLEALIALLPRIPGISKVHKTHGQQEHGRDLVFSTRMGFDEEVLCGCVVKNTRLSGKAADTRGVRTIFFQAEQALDTPYVDETGREIPITRVYIVSPFELSPFTITAIHGKLKEKSSRVAFWCGSRLFELFRRHWPDYLVDEFITLKNLLDRTANLAASNATLQELTFQYQLGNVDQDIRRIYVPQGFVRVLRDLSLGGLLRDVPDPKEFKRRVAYVDMKPMLESQ